jgi:hypothetical protein
MPDLVTLKVRFSTFTSAILTQLIVARSSVVPARLRNLLTHPMEIVAVWLTTNGVTHGRLLRISCAEMRPSVSPICTGGRTDLYVGINGYACRMLGDDWTITSWEGMCHLDLARVR